MFGRVAQVLSRRSTKRWMSDFKPREKAGFDVPIPPPMPEVQVLEPIANSNWGKFKMYLHAYPGK
jgi:hypothetical protein